MVRLILFVTGIYIGFNSRAFADYQHMGVATCASGVCHGSVNAHEHSDINRNEYYLWSSQDSHSKAFAVLQSTQGQAIAKHLKLGDARKAQECLVCHSDFTKSRGERFALSDGVGCEACHGGAEKWLHSHYREGTTHQQNIANGMTRLEDIKVRSQTCIGCHVGNDQGFATHAMMAAGHPRLRFELDTYITIQPAHFDIDADYRKRKKSYRPTQQWLFGQVEVAALNIKNIKQRLHSQTSIYPEWALFDCFSCHRNISNEENQHQGLVNSAGEVRLNSTALKLLDAINGALHLTQPPNTFADQIAQLHSSIASGGKDTTAQLNALEAQIDLLRNAIPKNLNRTQKIQLLNHLLQKQNIESFLDAEQLVMAVELMFIDLNSREDLSQLLGTALKLVATPEAYSASKFRQSLNAIAKKVPIK